MIAATLAWRNLWRNSKRSWITISAISTAFLILIVFSGLVGGLGTQMLVNGTEFVLGHLQVHHEDYLPDRGIYDWIGEEGFELDPLLEDLRRYPGVRAAAPRVFGFGLISTGNRSNGAELVGISPDAEASTSKLLGSLMQGRVMPGRAERSILIGDTLATALQAEIGSEVAVVTQASDGSLGNDLFRVSGIFDSGLAPLDRSMVLFHLWDLQQLMALEVWQVHEIALLAAHVQEAEALAGELNRSGILPPGAEAKSWGELLPQLREYLGTVDGFGWFLIVLVGVFAGIGTLNTMMMAVFERTREVGTLTALGLGPIQILLSFLLESLFLCLLGLGMGLVFGLGVTCYFNSVGLDLTRWTGEFSMVGSHFDPILRAEWAWGEILWAAGGLLLAVLLATSIPALRAARMDPVEALQEPVDG